MSKVNESKVRRAIREIVENSGATWIRDYSSNKERLIDGLYLFILDELKQSLKDLEEACGQS
jgi:hypothetical protein